MSYFSLKPLVFQSWVFFSVVTSISYVFMALDELPSLDYIEMSTNLFYL